MVKKLLVCLFILLLSCSHNSNREYKLTYVVHYSESSRDTTTLVSDEEFYWNCDRGNKRE